MTNDRLPHANLWRRFGAMVYDGLLLFGVFFVATTVLVVFRGGEAVPSQTLLYNVYLLVVAFVYFGVSWHWQGQTLGMRAWRVRVENQLGQPLAWRESLVRYLIAIVSLTAFGFGFLWGLVDKDGLTWHDRVSKTHLVYIGE